MSVGVSTLGKLKKKKNWSQKLDIELLVPVRLKWFWVCINEHSLEPGVLHVHRVYAGSGFTARVNRSYFWLKEKKYSYNKYIYTRQLYSTKSNFKDQ